jgi:hypothetical protein
VGQNYGTDKYLILFAEIFVPERMVFGTKRLLLESDGTYLTGSDDLVRSSWVAGFVAPVAAKITGSPKTHLPWPELDLSAFAAACSRQQLDWPDFYCCNSSDIGAI